MKYVFLNKSLNLWFLNIHYLWIKYDELYEPYNINEMKHNNKVHAQWMNHNSGWKYMNINYYYYVV